MLRMVSALVIALLFAAKADAQREPGLVAYWDFDKGKGNVLHDRSGNGNNGKIAGAHWLKGKGGFALQFDGVQSYVDCGNGKSLGIPGPLSISVWVMRAAPTPPQQRHYILGKADYNVYLTAGGRVAFSTISNAPEKKWTTVASRGVLPAGNWCHVAAVYDREAREERLYVNGVLDNTRVRTEDPLIWVEKPVNLVLGTGRFGTQRKMFFKGALCSVRIYDRVLSAEEVQILAQTEGAAKDGNMIPVIDVGFRPLPFFVGKNLRVNLDLSGVETLPFKPLLDVRVLAAGQELPVAARTLETLPDPRRVLVSFPSMTWPPGNYEIRATLRAPDKDVISTGSFQIPKYSSRPYIGLTRTPEDRPTSAPPAELRLKNDRIECEVSSATGEVVRVNYLRKNMLVVIENHDIYVFDGKDGARVPESADKVMGYRPGAEGKLDGFELVCTNPSLPDIELTKAYRLEKDHVAKTVYFRATSEKNDGKLIFLRSALNMAPEFYRGGYHYRPIWDGGSGPGTGTVPFTPGSDVTARKPVRDLHGAFFAYWQPKASLLFAQYRFKINGRVERFVTTAFQPDIIDDQGYFDPQGWEEYISGDVIREGYFLSCETHMAVLEGDARAFHEHHMNLPDVAAMAKSNVPEWWHRVKTVGPYSYDSVAYDTGWCAARAKNILADFEAGEMLPLILSDYCMTGDYPSKGPIIPLNPSDTHSAKRSAQSVKADLNRLHQIDPRRVRLALYTWYGSASDKSQTYKDHPEWLLRNQNGDLCQYGSGETYNYFLNCVTQDQVDFILDQRREILKNYDVDMTYVDGSHGEAVNFFPEMNYVHNYHAHIVLRGMKLVAEEMGKIHFQNGGCYPDTSHGGFFEYGAFFDPVDKKDWRTMANMSYVMARSMRPPNVSCILYWNSQRHSNSYAMYGLKPHLGTLWTSLGIAHTLLMADLSYEIKDSELLVNDNVRPNWWRLETETLESALLKQERSYLLPLVNHAQEDRTETVTVSLAGLDVDPRKPVYAWQIQPLIEHAHYQPPFTVPLRESYDAVAYQFGILTPEDGALKVVASELKHNLLRMITLSQTPGFVYSVGGRRMNYMVCSARGVAIDGRMGPNDVTLSVQSEAAAAEILALLPAGWEGARATVNGEPASCEVLTLGAQSFTKMSVGTGAAQVVVTRGRAGGRATLDPPRRNEYIDYALIYLPDQGSPKITADRFGGLPCWKMTGPGRLIGPFNSPSKGTKGVTFKLNPGSAKGEIVFAFGHGQNAFVKTIPLTFAGWKEFTILEDQFDTHPKVAWERTTALYWTVPKGGVYVSDFRFVARPESEKVVEKLQRKQAVIPYLSTPPPLTGGLNQADWARAARLEVAGSQTVFYVGYDDRNLYVAARCNEPILRLPPKPVRDARQCCKAPNIEIYVMPKGVNKVYQFCVMAGGGQWDAVYDDPTVRLENIDWNGTWKAATDFGYQMSWQAEVAIPWSDFDLPAPTKGDAWVVGLFRQGGQALLSGWAYSGGAFFNPDANFGKFVFGGK